MKSIAIYPSLFDFRFNLALWAWLFIIVNTSETIFAQQSSIAEEEYEVLKQFIKDTFEDYPQIILNDSTIMDEVSYLHDESPYIIKDFEIKNRERFSLDKEYFNLPDMEIDFVNEQYLRQLMKANNHRFILDIIFEKYPKSKGLLSLTRVAFNKNQDVALFSYRLFDKMYANPGDDLILIQYKRISEQWVKVEIDIEN